jgi:ABC-type amino acid transport substrate-binding protein
MKPQRKPIIILIVSIAYMAFNIACNAAETTEKTAPSNAIQKILKKGKLVVAMYEKDAPPFYYVDAKNNLTGIDVVLINGFAELLGVSVEFDRSAKFIDDVITKVENHEADLGISKLSQTFKRSESVLFSNPYIELHQSLLVNRLHLSNQLRGRPKPEVIQHLEGKLGVLAKSSYVGYSKYFSKMELTQYQKWDDAVSDVVSGKITAAFRDEAEVKLALKNNPEIALQLLTVILNDAKDLKGIVVAFENRELKDIIDYYLNSLDMKLTADSLINDYDKTIDTIQNKIKQKKY